MNENETGMTFSLSHFPPLGMTFSLSIDTEESTFFSNQRDVDCAVFFDMLSLFPAVFKTHRMIAAGTPPS